MRSFTNTERKEIVSYFNQEKALVGAFSVIVQPVVEPMEHYTALNLLLASPLPLASTVAGAVVSGWPVLLLNMHLIRYSCSVIC